MAAIPNKKPGKTAPRKKAKIQKGNNEKIDVEQKRRIDWENNDIAISSAVYQLLDKNKKFPTTQAIADATNLTWLTVKKHLDEFDFESVKQRFRAANERVMINLLKQAATGKEASMIKLWFEVTEGLGNKKALDVTSGGKPLPAPVTQEELALLRKEINGMGEGK